MIDVGITVPGKNQYNLWPSPVPFHKAFLSVTNIVFAYGTLALICADTFLANGIFQQLDTSLSLASSASSRTRKTFPKHCSCFKSVTFRCMLWLG
jgi:hypothetical protein